MPKIAPKLYMAPLKGFTDRVFRTVYATHFSGFDLAVAPFISSKTERKINRKYVRDVWPENNPALPVVPQILSKSAADFTFLANYLHEFGYETVNWNLGCPYPTVAKKQRGAGMLPYTDRIRQFLDEALPLLKNRLSIKIRLGWKSTAEIVRLIPILNQYPLQEVIIHARTGLQRYEGEVDLAAFGDCLAQLRHPVIYNGDIKTVADFQVLVKRFENVQGWMIGRWCIADPMLPQRIKNTFAGAADLPESDRIPVKALQRMQQFHDGLLAGYREVLDGPAHVLNKMKGLWKYFALFFEDFPKTLKKIRKSAHPDQYRERVNRFFETEAKPRGHGDRSRFG